MDQNIEEFMQLLFADEIEEFADSNNIFENASSSVISPALHAGEPCMNRDGLVPLEQQAIYRELYEAACGQDHGCQQAATSASFVLPESTELLTAATVVGSQDIPAEGNANTNISIVLEPFLDVFGSQEIQQLDQIDAAEFRTESANNFLMPPESSSSVLGSQDVPQGNADDSMMLESLSDVFGSLEQIQDVDKIDQIEVPPPNEYNSGTANNSQPIPESSSNILGSTQQQSNAQQSNPKRSKKVPLEPIPILVKSKNKSKNASSSSTFSGASFQHPFGQGLPRVGFSSYPNQALSQCSGWPYQPVTPPAAASSPLSPQQVVRGSTYHGFALGLLNSKPGALTVGSMWNPRELDLKAWASAPPAANNQQRLGSSIGLSTLPATQTPQQGFSSTNSSSSTSQSTSSSASIRKRKATGEGDATASSSYRSLDFTPQSDRSIFQTWISQLPRSNRGGYDSQGASDGQFLDPCLPYPSGTILDFQNYNNTTRDEAGSSGKSADKNNQKR